MKTLSLLAGTFLLVAVPVLGQQNSVTGGADPAVATRAIDSALEQAKAMRSQDPNSQGKSSDNPQIRTQQAIEKAMTQMQARQETELRAGPKTGLSADEVRRMKGADPAELAKRYQQIGSNNQPQSPEFMIFISTSMPKPALTMLGRQAAATGAVLVLRGMKGPLGTKDLVQKTTEALQPIAATGATVKIDPEAFQRYHVTAVPTFVLGVKNDEESCAADQCDSKAYALAGDVTVQFALEHWSSQGGTVGRIADGYLKRLERQN